MRKKQIKAKEAIKIRFKEVANGNQSIYLDCYINGKRNYEFLQLYIIPEKTKADKAMNENTMQAAMAIKNRRLMDMANGKAGLVKKSIPRLLLADWLQAYAESKENFRYRYALMAVRRCAMEVCESTRTLYVADVDKSFALAYIEYVKTDFKDRLGKRLGQITQHNYCLLLSCALNKAVREGYLAVNPFKQLEKEDKISKPESKRIYLTTDEVRRLIDTPLPKYVDTGAFDIVKYENVKRGFLFSCYTGLRMSDVMGLRWADVIADKGKMHITVKQQKTGKINTLLLTQSALEWMPKRETENSGSAVFRLPTETVINKWVKRWAAAAGIEKNISFHTARHTFATSLLTAGVDLYTTSKLLGHNRISTTEAYAKVIDKKRDEAISLLDNLF